MVVAVEIPREQWSSYLDAVTHDQEGTQLSIEIFGNGLPAETIAHGLALQFLAYHAREQLFEVAGENDPCHGRDAVHHMVAGPCRIVADNPPGAPLTIDVRDHDGRRTVITLG